MIVLQRFVLSILAAALAVGSLFVTHPAPPAGQVSTSTAATSTEVAPGTPAALISPAPNLVPFIEVRDSCGPSYNGTCVNLRSGPGTQYHVVQKLRTGMVLQVKDSVVKNGRTWLHLLPDQDVLYPERITSDWYVAADLVDLFYDDGAHLLKGAASTTKRIVVDRSEQMLYAYDGRELYMQSKVSTGLDLTPTPRGVFTVFKMTPSRYMQGPVPGVSDQFYDLPGVPWDLYFTAQGAVIHGAYWHNSFGRPWSHGCVNLPLADARKLYEWAVLGTKVIVQD